MANQNTHDRYIYLQVILKELESKGKEDEEFGYHYQVLSEKIDKQINAAISQGMTEISEFQHLLRTVKEKKDE